MDYIYDSESDYIGDGVIAGGDMLGGWAKGSHLTLEQKYKAFIARWKKQHEGSRKGALARFRELHPDFKTKKATKKKATKKKATKKKATKKKATKKKATKKKVSSIKVEKLKKQLKECHEQHKVTQEEVANALKLVDKQKELYNKLKAKFATLK
jgi:hypothetical protein